MRIQGRICREKGAAHRGGPCQNRGLVGEPGIWGWGRTRCLPSQGSRTGSSASAIDFLLWSSGRKMRRWGCGAATVICCLLGVSWRGWELILEALESVSRAGVGEMWGVERGQLLGARHGPQDGGDGTPQTCSWWSPRCAGGDSFHGGGDRQVPLLLGSLPWYWGSRGRAEWDLRGSRSGGCGCRKVLVPAPAAGAGGEE